MKKSGGQKSRDTLPLNRNCFDTKAGLLKKCLYEMIKPQGAFGFSMIYCSSSKKHTFPAAELYVGFYEIPDKKFVKCEILDQFLFLQKYFELIYGEFFFSFQFLT